MGAVEEMVCVCCRLGIVVMDVIWRRLCVSMIWASVRRENISSELLMCGGGVCSILFLPLVARYLETIDVCIWHMFLFMTV